jgi:PAS domain S-box-containing protein
MSSRHKHKRPIRPGARVAIPGEPVNWAHLEQYNDLGPARRAQALAEIGIEASSRDVLGILTKSHFVIPGTTRFECQHCGECCRYARKLAQLTYEPCPFLTDDNCCAKHEGRYLVCKWFPFWLHTDPRLGEILTIKPYCSGYGKGPVVDYAGTVRQMRALAAAEAQDSDGAFVIHEVILIPGAKDWAFPSRANVDALMRQLAAEAQQAAARTPEHTIERMGEVHFAHHYTSGLLGSTNAPLVTVDERGGITDANDSSCRLFQRERRALVTRPLSSFFVNPEQVAASLRVCFSQGKETASPLRLRLPDDSAVPVLLDGLVYRDRSDGLVHGLILCVNSASTAVYHEVRQSREYARGLLEASLDALMVIDKDGAIIDVNQAAVQVSGRAREMLIGSPFRDLFEDPASAQQGVELAFRDGMVRNYVLTLVSSQQEAIPVSFNAAVYRDSDGVVQGVFAAARDIRERLKMMRALQDAQNYSRGLIECCLDLMVTINRAGIITDANRAASELTGYPRERIIGSPFKDFFDDAERAQSGVRRTFEEGEVRGYHMNLATVSGGTLAVSFNATLYRDSSDHVQGVFAIARPKEHS